MFCLVSNMGEQYFQGVLAAYFGSSFINAPISEWQIDMVKEDLSRFCEAMIDHSQLSYQEKEEQKRQMKQRLELYICGFKDELRAVGRLV